MVQGAGTTGRKGLPVRIQWLLKCALESHARQIKRGIPHPGSNGRDSDFTILGEGQKNRCCSSGPGDSIECSTPQPTLSNGAASQHGGACSGLSFLLGRAGPSAVVRGGGASPTGSWGLARTSEICGLDRLLLEGHLEGLIEKRRGVAVNTLAEGSFQLRASETRGHWLRSLWLPWVAQEQGLIKGEPRRRDGEQLGTNFLYGALQCCPVPARREMERGSPCP